MLDAYIIDRIRKERESSRKDGALVPLHIERRPPPNRPLPPLNSEVEKEPERGSVVIDFSA